MKISPVHKGVLEFVIGNKVKQKRSSWIVVFPIGWNVRFQHSLRKFRNQSVYKYSGVMSRNAEVAARGKVLSALELVSGSGGGAVRTCSKTNFPAEHIPEIEFRGGDRLEVGRWVMRVRQPPRVKHRNRVISLTAGLSGNLRDEEGRYFRERERERKREHGKQTLFNEWQLVKLLSFFNLRRKNFFFWNSDL